MISVITATLPDRGRLLAECAATIASQTLQPAAWYVGVDHERNGPAAILNGLAAKVDTPWLFRLDDDDLLVVDDEFCHRHRGRVRLDVRVGATPMVKRHHMTIRRGQVVSTHAEGLAQSSSDGQQPRTGGALVIGEPSHLGLGAVLAVAPPVGRVGNPGGGEDATPAEAESLVTGLAGPEAGLVTGRIEHREGAMRDRSRVALTIDPSRLRVGIERDATLTARLRAAGAVPGQGEYVGGGPSIVV